MDNGRYMPALVPCEGPCRDAVPADILEERDGRALCPMCIGGFVEDGGKP